MTEMLRATMMKKGKRDKVLKDVCIIAAVVTAAALILFGKFEYATKYKTAVIDSSVSPDAKYELLFQSVGEPDWPFGPSHARLVLKYDGKAVTKYPFDVANDGKTLCAGNWQAAWKDGSVEVLIIGEEQQDMLYSLSFNGEVTIR